MNKPHMKKQIKDLKELFPGVFYYKKSLYTKNLVKGIKVYDEELINLNNTEFRSWNPYKSKLAAAIIKGVKKFVITPGSKVLYLGAATGTTVSHVSDIVGYSDKGYTDKTDDKTTGFVWALDIAPITTLKLLVVCKQRYNIAPLLFNALNAKTYKEFTSGKVDVLYQDIAHKQQLNIFLNNANLFLKPKSHGLLVVKARSIDVAKKPQEMFNKVLKELSKHGVIEQALQLEPFEKDHLFIDWVKR